jgi:proline iminopeptidase
VNTTAHLVADIEVLREFLRVDRWTILGLSWGTTLGLAYAQAYPHRVRALALGFITTTSKREVQWVTGDVGRVFPREWERFAAAVSNRLRHLRLVDAYACMLSDPDPNVREHAAREWCLWEDAHISLTPGHSPDPR